MNLLILLLLIFNYGCSDSSESSSLVVNGGSSSSTSSEESVSNVKVLSSLTIESGNYKLGDEILINAIFSGAVQIENSPTIVVKIGSNDFNFSYLSGSQTDTIIFAYTVQDGDEDLDGIDATKFDISGSTIKDLQGINVDLTVDSTNFEDVKIKTSTASISSITPPTNKVFINSESLSFDLIFSEVVTVRNMPLLIVDIGGSDYSLNYVSGSNSTTLNFSLEVPEGLLDLNGIELKSIDLGSGSILDQLEFDVEISFTSPDLSLVQVDSQVPTIDTFLLDSGALYSNAASTTITLVATDASEYYITSDNSCESGGSWIAYTSSFTETLTSNSPNSFYIKVRDENLNESNCLNASITHDNLSPDAPSVINIASDASDIATDLSSWSAVSDNGLAGIAGYEYAVSTSNDDTNIITGGSWTDTASSLSFQISTGVSLVGGTNYYTLVRSIDNAGNTSSSTASAAWTIVVSPEVVTNLEASERTVDTIGLGWSYPIDNGTAITDYDVQVKGGDYTDWTTIADGISTDTSLSISSLDPETTYQFQIRAYNGINYSGWSNILEAETLPDLDFFQGGYKAINISGAPKSKVVSFDDNNEIYVDGTLAATLDRGETHEFDSEDFTVLEGSKALFVAGKLGTGSGSSDQGNATWATSSWVGDEFYFNLTRMAPLKIKVYAFTDSDITIKTGDSTVDTHTLSAEIGHTFTLNNYANYQMTSTGLIVAFIYGNQSGLIYDPQPLLPVSTDIIGFPSSTAKVTSGTDSNPYTFYNSNDVSTTGTLSAASTTSVSPQGTSSLYRSESLRIITTEPISANSNADSDGYCQAAFVPVSMMKKRFGINSASEWIALASDREVTVTITTPDNTTLDVTLTRSGTGKTPYKAYISTAYVAGTILEGTDKFQAWYQPTTTDYSGGDDETVMFGWDN